ncbi:hypothetical protein F5X68DRAFT_245588 [Plectosphaerella plurivora]|uniref:Uncharacterized protein n=1 Tax=Plectosphaerella plurivora TaxID=936078 RepID=A0A9P8V5S5_9PEZI|nr:hypothetical protein F5X68DRAFT_245588 [Plectosphaerella plurivora]
MHRTLLLSLLTLHSTAAPVADPISATIPSQASLTASATVAFNGTTSSSSSLVAARPLSTTDLSFSNLRECTIPSTSDISFNGDDLHAFIDPNNGHVDELSPGLWNALSMDAWLKALITNCPALYLPGNYVDKTAYKFPVALGKVVIASSQTVKCADFQDCMWSPYGENFPGPDRPPTVLNHSDASITNLRKWYALSAIHEVHFYYAQMKFNFEQAKTWGDSTLGTLVNNLDPEPEEKEQGFGVDIWLDIAGAVLAFTPLSSAVSNFFTSLKSQAKIAQQREILLAGMQRWRPFASENLKGAAKAGFAAIRASQPNPAKPEDQYSKWATFSSDFGSQMSHMSTQLSSIWEMAMYGDPTAQGGFLDMVMGGAFSGKQTGSPKVSDDMRIKYQQYILEKAAMSIWASQKISIYTSQWDDKAGCEGALAVNVIPGQACFQDPAANATGWIYYAPFKAQTNFERNRWRSDGHKWYKGLDQNALVTTNYKLNMRDIYEGSAACFDANNYSIFYIAGFDATVGVRGITLPNLYTPGTPSYSNDAGTSDPSKAECHWSMPVLKSNSTTAAAGCQMFRDACETYQKPDRKPVPPCRGIRQKPNPDYRFIAYASQLFLKTYPVECNPSRSAYRGLWENKQWDDE